MPTWDRRTDKQRAALQDELVRTQVRAVAASSAYWKQRFAALGRTAASVDGVTALATIPAVGERDVSPTGDAASMASLVMHGGERQFALHTSGPQLRRAIRVRASSRREYQRLVASETKPTTYVWSGLGFRYPLASTRGDLDVVARAGARMWQVLGLTADDALLSAMPSASTVEQVALQYAALAAGAPALHPGASSEQLVIAATLAPPTVLAVPSAAAVDVIGLLVDAGALRRLTTLLLVGAPSDEERAAAAQALGAAGLSQAVVLGVHAPSGARVLWAECRGSAGATGLHTYPDLEVAQVVDPETGEAATSPSGELVLTQLGMRGSALLRWRTGDLVTGVDTSMCPSCGRSVPRVLDAAAGALVVGAADGQALDLRAVAGALAGRGDIADWRVVIGPRPRDSRNQVVVHVVPSEAAADAADAAVAAVTDVRALAGTLPSQLVVSEDLDGVQGTTLTRRLLRR